MARKLELARHAHGFDAIGWVLLGFVLGAGLAVFALLHADSVLRRAPPAPPRAAASPAPAQPAWVHAPPAALAPLPAVLPVPPESASPPGPVALAGAAGARSAPAAAKPNRPPAPKPAPKPAPRADQEVADDAAAAGLTSRSGSGDLY
jgi:hypothetical protein